MPNIIVDLTREMRRVEQLVPRLNIQEREKAQRTLYFANTGMTTNSLEAMQESLDDLRLIQAPKK